jgi:hypothetical protein
LSKIKDASGRAGHSGTGGGLARRQVGKIVAISAESPDWNDSKH